MTAHDALHITLAEQNLLSALLCDPENTIPAVHGLNAQAFGDKLHGDLFTAVVTSQRTDNAFDAATLLGSSSLRDADTEQILPLLEKLYRAGRTAKLAGKYVDAIIEAARRREAGKVAVILGKDASDGKPSAEIIATLRSNLDELSSLYAVGDKHTRSAASLVPAAIKAAEERSQCEGVPGIPSGISDLDEVTNGWRPGDLIIVGGRPSMGKSVLLSCFTSAASTRSKIVAHFSIEMNGVDTMGRIICNLCTIDLKRWHKGRMEGEESQRLNQKHKQLCALPLEINDITGLKPSMVVDTAERIRDRWGGLDLVVVDYLQRMRSDTGGKHFDPRVDAATIAWELKNTARRLEVPVITASQLGRQVDRRDDKRPMLSDFMESGNLEAEADIAIFIYRPEYYAAKEKAETEDLTREERASLFLATQEAELIIGKNRNGPTGTVKAEFHPRYARFRNLTESLH